MKVTKDTSHEVTSSKWQEWRHDRDEEMTGMKISLIMKDNKDKSKSNKTIK